MAALSPDYSANLLTFKTMFISIFLEALPFILMGVFFSALLQMLVSEQLIARIIPKKPLLGMLSASLLGFIFPICECGMIPVIRRLISKGMPVYIAVIFILSGPILNPIVFFATYTAFRSRPEVIYSRMGLAFIASLVIGILIYRLIRYNPLRLSTETIYGDQTDEAKHQSVGEKLTSFFMHMINEFFEMSKYLILGAFVTALIHTFVNTSQLLTYGQGSIKSHLFMAGFAYVLSICSTSDAFVASSFVNTFSAGSLITFLVLGPMLDFKSTLMLLSVFKTKFVISMGALIVITVLALSIGLDFLF
ncbi:putative permease [compost metagenome]